MQQALVDLRGFDDDAVGVAAQAGLVRLGQGLGGKEQQRGAGARPADGFGVGHALVHAAPSQIDHRQAPGTLRQRFPETLSGRALAHLAKPGADQPRHSAGVDAAAGHDQQRRPGRQHLALRPGDLVGVHRFLQVADDPLAQQRRVPVAGRDHVHRDRGQIRVGFHRVEHAGSVHVRQPQIEQDAGRAMLAGQRQTVGPVAGEQGFVAELAVQLHQRHAEHRIVVDQQDHAVAGIQPVAVVARHLRRLDRGRRRGGAAGWRRPAVGICRHRLTGGMVGQAQREDAALPRRAFQLDVAAQQAGEAAADGQSQAGAAVFP